MSAYNFQKQFAPMIKSGKKRSTIRARRKNGYIPVRGEKIKLYTGMRTKSCRLLRTVTVKQVREVSIVTHEQYVGKCGVFIGMKHLTPPEIDKLAKRDGFKSAEDFAKFFRDNYGDWANLYLIEW